MNYACLIIKTRQLQLFKMFFFVLKEGWRLEHEVTEDKSTPIIFKGVVFNEMKGYYVSDANYRTDLILICIKLLLSKQGNSSYLLSEAIQKLLLPDGTYGCSSGGEPLAIPQLTWQKLKQFHQDHFHPSNTTYFLYVLHVNIDTL